MFLLLALVAYTAAAPQLLVRNAETYAAPSLVRSDVIVEEHLPAAPYSFGFNVDDNFEGNYQAQEQHSDGHGVTTGSYQVADPDGFIRTVYYTADAVNGFQAEVVRTPGGIHVETPTHADARGIVHVLDEGFRTVPVEVATRFEHGATVLTDSHNVRTHIEPSVFRSHAVAAPAVRTVEHVEHSPAFVRSHAVAAPAVRTVEHVEHGPAFVRSHAVAAPAVRTVEHVEHQPIVRTHIQPGAHASHSSHVEHNAAPSVVRTIEHEPVAVRTQIVEEPFVRTHAFADEAVVRSHAAPVFRRNRVHHL